jgi:hypothetical protein
MSGPVKFGRVPMAEVGNDRYRENRLVDSTLKVGLYEGD